MSMDVVGLQSRIFNLERQLEETRKKLNAALAENARLRARLQEGAANAGKR